MEREPNMKLLFLLCATAAIAQTDPKPEPTHRDIRYGPHERHTLDVWCAKGDAPAPLEIGVMEIGVRSHILTVAMNERRAWGSL